MRFSLRTAGHSKKFQNYVHGRALHRLVQLCADQLGCSHGPGDGRWHLRSALDVADIVWLIEVHEAKCNSAGFRYSQAIMFRFAADRESIG
jgi:hypothetical protein